MNMNELYARHLLLMQDRDEKVQALEEKVEKKREKARKLVERSKKISEDVDQLLKQERSIPAVDWKETIVEPLAEALRDATGKRNCKCLGPHGIGAKVDIYLFDEAEFRLAFDREESYLALTVEPDLCEGGAISLRYETGEMRDLYSKGSVGAESGLNAETAPLPDSIDAIAALLRESLPMKVKRVEPQ